MAPVTGSSPYTELGCSTQARRHWHYIRGGCLGLRRLRRGESSTACSPQDIQLQGQPAFPAVLREPDGALHASSHRRQITDEYTKWTVFYLLTIKNQALQSLQLFVGPTIILFGGRIVRWRADKGGEYTGEEFLLYCLGTGIIQEFAATNTPQKIGVSERVGITLCAWLGACSQTAIYHRLCGGSCSWRCRNRTPHKTLEMETPFKMLHGEKADLSHLRVIGARNFVHIKDSRKIDAATWEGKMCSYSQERKPYRVWNPKTHHVVESRNVTFIETSPHPLPTPSKLSPLQDLVPPS